METLKPRQSLIVRIMDFLIKPSKKVGDIGDRQNARLAALISLSLILIFSVFMYNASISGEPPYIVDIISLLILIGIYVSSRTRLHKLGILLLMFLVPGNTFINVFLGTTYHINSTLQFLALGYGLAATFLNPVWTGVFTAANLAVLMLVPQSIPEDLVMSVNMPVQITINILLGVMAIIANIHKANIQQARLDENRRNSAAALTSLTRALEVRHKETAGHATRAVDLTLALAKRCGITSKKQLRHIQEGALLHDIGKIAVSDTILLKEDKLTPEEWEKIKAHPQIGYELLKEFEFLKDSLAIPRYHHERYDGSGYPEGLVGEQIPIEARIFAVVDVFDALLEDRPYRKPWPMDRIIDHLQQNAGSLYDPLIIDHFFELMKFRGE